MLTLTGYSHSSLKREEENGEDDVGVDEEVGGVEAALVSGVHDE